MVMEKMGRRSQSALTLLDHLYFKPVINIDIAHQITGLTYPNANKLVKDLCDIDLLSEITGFKLREDCDRLLSIDR